MTTTTTTTVDRRKTLTMTSSLMLCLVSSNFNRLFIFVSLAFARDAPQYFRAAQLRPLRQLRRCLGLRMLRTKTSRLETLPAPSIGPLLLHRFCHGHPASRVASPSMRVRACVSRPHSLNCTLTGVFSVLLCSLFRALHCLGRRVCDQAPK